MLAGRPNNVFVVADDHAAHAIGAYGLHAEQGHAGWRNEVYYRYWEHDDGIHHVWAHYGIRTARWKLVRCYAAGLGLPGASDRTMSPEWELFDLETDPREMHSRHDDPAYEEEFDRLRADLFRVQRELGDQPHEPD